jgi:NhaC family Na+:H+ antiporter
MLHRPRGHESAGVSQPRPPREPSLLDAVVPLVSLALLFAGSLALRGLARTNLSRLAADSGTVTSPLVPWNSCGAFMGTVLGVPTVSFAGYAVFCWASPLLSVVYGITGFRIEKVQPQLDQEAPR